MALWAFAENMPKYTNVFNTAINNASNNYVEIVLAEISTTKGN